MVNNNIFRLLSVIILQITNERTEKAKSPNAYENEDARDARGTARDARGTARDARGTHEGRTGAFRSTSSTMPPLPPEYWH